jgi:hypothetical protein
MNKPYVHKAAAAVAAVVTTLVLLQSVASLADQDRAAVVAAKAKPTQVALQAKAELQR